MIAAGRTATDIICSEIVKASEARPTRKALSEAERQAWNNLVDVWGDEARSLTRPCARDIAEAGVKAMMDEADKLLSDPVIKKAFDKFIMLCELTKKQSK